MDRATELAHHSPAKKHVAEVMRHIEINEAIVRDGERGGLDTAMTKRVLELVKWNLESRELVVAELQRIASWSARRSIF